MKKEKLEKMEIFPTTRQEEELPYQHGSGQIYGWFDTKLEDNDGFNMQFMVRFTQNDQEDIMSYNEIVNFVTRETNEQNEEHWRFRKIVGHEKVKQNHKNYKWSSNNLRAAWKNNEILEVPLKLFADDAPVECTLYAKINYLLIEPGCCVFQSCIATRIPNGSISCWIK